MCSKFQQSTTLCQYLATEVMSQQMASRNVRVIAALHRKRQRLRSILGLMTWNTTLIDSLKKWIMQRLKIIIWIGGVCSCFRSFVKIRTQMCPYVTSILPWSTRIRSFKFLNSTVLFNTTLARISNALWCSRSARFSIPFSSHKYWMFTRLSLEQASECQQ